MRPSADTGSLPRAMLQRTASERGLLRASSATARRAPMTARARSQPSASEADEPQRRSRRRSLWGGRALAHDSDEQSSCLPAWRLSSASATPAPVPADFDLQPPDAGLPPPRVRLNRLRGAHELDESFVQRQFARMYAERRAVAEQRGRKARPCLDDDDDPAEHVEHVPRAHQQPLPPTANTPDMRRKRVSQLIRSAFVRTDDNNSSMTPHSTNPPRSLRYSMRARTRKRSTVFGRDLDSKTPHQEALRLSAVMEREETVQRTQRDNAQLDDSLKLTRRMQQEKAKLQSKSNKRCGATLVPSRGDRALAHQLPKDSPAHRRSDSDHQMSASSLPSLGRRPPTAPVRRPSALSRSRESTLTTAKLRTAELKRAAAAQAATVAADARGPLRERYLLSEVATSRPEKRAMPRVRSTSSAIFTPSTIDVIMTTESDEEAEAASGMFSDAEADEVSAKCKVDVKVLRSRDLNVRDWSPVSSACDADTPSRHACVQPAHVRAFIAAGPKTTAATLRATESKPANAREMDVKELEKAQVRFVTPKPLRFARLQPADEQRPCQWGGSGRSKSLGKFAKRARGRVRSALGPLPPTHTPNVKARWARRNVSAADKS